ncbi:MAG: hypothetical protein N2712_07145 [Brevinematales bacterium]|nr:hypothetical protein [Brevinematales bacterium]
MRKLLVILSITLSVLSAMAQNRERFYAGEELFYSSEYVKAIGIYRTLQTNTLQSYEINTLNYKLSFFTNLNGALKVLSNSNLPEAKELMSFILAYLGFETTNVIDIINTKEETQVYKTLNTITSQTGRINTDLSVKLYFSLSNYKDRISFKLNSDFYTLKSKFIDGIIYKNIGKEDLANQTFEDIVSNYPNSFWARVINSEKPKQQLQSSTQSSETTQLEVGYYFVIDKYDNVMKKSLELRKFKVIEKNNRIYIGPYKSLNEIQKEAEKVSRDYRVEVKIIQVRSE